MNSTCSTSSLANTSLGTNGSHATTRRPNACAFGTISCGILPKPTSPKTLPRSRWIGTKFGIFHVPECTCSVAIGIFLTAESSSAIAWSDTSSMQ